MSEPGTEPNMENKCPACGTPLPSGGLAGLCPACLLKQAAAETATQPEAPPFQAPTVAEVAALFPQLEILALLGKGGMGAVYQARQPGLDRLVALKILPAQAATGTDFTERFNREARALAKLNHPNIVTVFEFGQVNGIPFFIMEYVDGLNLRQLEQSGKLTPREALQIVPQICEALQFAHDAGIVHRDIKPDNILLDKKGRVKIADFGIAKLLGTPPDTAIPETQGALGTPNYMAPEQIEKPQSVDHRADIFSLGVVFYEMLTGELPMGKFSPPSSGPRGLRVDVRLDEVVLRALEKEPDRRYQHASQVKAAVETIAGTPPGAPPNSPPAPPSISGPPPEEILSRDYVLDISACLSRAWALLTAHFLALVGMTALIIVLLSIADSTFVHAGSTGSDATEGVSILALLLNGPLLAGLFLYFLKTMRGEPATVETAFSGFSKRFLHLFLAHFVVTALTVLGFFCLILPGIYLLVAWSFTLVLVMDKGLDFWPAMELSRKMVNKHWWKVLFLLLLLAVIWLAGLLACCVGVFITATIAIAVYLYAYEDIFGQRTPVAPASDQPLPPPVIPPAAPTGVSAPLRTSEPAGPDGPTGPDGKAKFPSAPAPPKSGSALRTLFLIGLGLAACLVILILTIVLTVFAIRSHRAHRVFQVYASQPAVPAMPAMPSPPAIPAIPAMPAPPASVPTPALDALTERIRHELDQSGIRFDQLKVSSPNDTQMFVSFTDLQKKVSVNGTDSWESMVGLMEASTNVSGGWTFSGQGQLDTVHFDLAQLDVKQVRAEGATLANQPAAHSGPSHDQLAARLEAAEGIADISKKGKSLAGIALAAAGAGESELAKSALDQITDYPEHDTATRNCALLLAKAGLAQVAVEMAQNISDLQMRDETLSELAK